MNTTAEIAALPANAARMLAVEILLADPEALGDDVLESCLYILREKLRSPLRPTRRRHVRLRSCRNRVSGLSRTVSIGEVASSWSGTTTGLEVPCGITCRPGPHVLLEAWRYIDRLQPGRTRGTAPGKPQGNPRARHPHGHPTS